MQLTMDERQLSFSQKAAARFLEATCKQPRSRVVRYLLPFLAILLALSAGAVTSRWMQRPQIRALHPWFGAAAMLLAAAQVFFGLQLTP